MNEEIIHAKLVWDGQWLLYWTDDGETAHVIHVDGPRDADLEHLALRIRPIFAEAGEFVVQVQRDDDERHPWNITLLPGRTFAWRLEDKEQLS